jgi:hypothetical protein
MELIAAILLAGPLGSYGGSRKRGLSLYLLAWGVIFPIQTIAVVSPTRRNDFMYWVVNTVILAAGVGLNTLRARLRERRMRTARSAS